MTRTVDLPNASRDSRTADRRKRATASPFRSRNEPARVHAARLMVAKRKAEIVALTAEVGMMKTPRAERVLATRIRATRNNLASWERYLQHNTRQARAVIIP